MNAKARTARQIIKSRKNLSTRVQARRSQVRPHSIASYLIAAGTDAKTATGMVGSLHTVSKRLNLVPLKGRTERTASGATRRERVVNRYTKDQVVLIMDAYRPRKAEYKAAVEQFRKAA